MNFEWNLDPEIVNLFGIFSLRYYSLFFVVGLLLGLRVVKRLWIQDKWNVQELEKLTIWVFLATMIGARLGHCLFYDPVYYLSHPMEMLLPFNFDGGKFNFTGYLGLASHGGILAVFLTIWAFSRRSNYSVFSLLDKISIGGALTGVFIRLANFMNSEILGKATNSNYGVVFKRVDEVLRHPAQLYEAIAYFIIFLIIYKVYQERRNKAAGFVFGLFFVLLFSARFFIEFFKENQVDFEAGMALNMGQWLSIPFVILGLVIMWLKRSTRVVV